MVLGDGCGSHSFSSAWYRKSLVLASGPRFPAAAGVEVKIRAWQPLLWLQLSCKLQGFFLDAACMGHNTGSPCRLDCGFMPTLLGKPLRVQSSDPLGNRGSDPINLPALIPVVKEQIFLYLKEDPVTSPTQDAAHIQLAWLDQHWTGAPHLATPLSLRPRA